MAMSFEAQQSTRNHVFRLLSCLKGRGVDQLELNRINLVRIDYLTFFNSRDYEFVGNSTFNTIRQSVTNEKVFFPSHDELRRIFPSR
jgi:hypothetical protein